MAKVNVKICMGTTCFVMGSSQLQDLVDIVNKRYGEDVVVVGSTCLNYCTDNSEYSKAPYVKVDDVIIQEATIDKVLQEIDRKLKEDGKQ